MQTLFLLSLMLPMLGLLATRWRPQAAWLPRLLLALRTLLLLDAVVLVATENTTFARWGLSVTPLCLVMLLPVLWETLSEDLRGVTPSLPREAEFLLLVLLCTSDSLLGSWACLALLVLLQQRSTSPTREQLLREALCLSLFFLGLLALAWAGSKAAIENAWSISSLAEAASRLDPSLCVAASLFLGIGLLGLLGFWPSPQEQRLLFRLAIFAALLRLQGVAALVIGPEKALFVPQLLSLLTLISLLLQPNAIAQLSLSRFQDATVIFAMSFATRGTMQAALLLFLVWFASYPRPQQSRSLRIVAIAASLGAPPLAGTLAFFSLLGSATAAVSTGSLWASLSSWKLLFLLAMVWFHLLHQRTRLPELSWEAPRRADYLWLVLLIAFGMYLPESVDSLLGQAARLALGR